MTAVTAVKVATSFSYEDLVKALTGFGAPFIRQITRLAPAANPVAAAVYAGTGTEKKAYATAEMLMGDTRKTVVVLSSVAAGANKLEEALLQALRDGHIRMPNLTVDYSGSFPFLGKLTSLEQPQRHLDFFTQATLVNGVPFKKSELALEFAKVGVRNHTPVYQITPHALVLGYWDSRRPGGGKDAKCARVLSSEIIGMNVVPFCRTKSRQGPISVGQAVSVYQSDPALNPLHDWTSDPDLALKNASGEALVYKNSDGDKDGRASVIGASDVAPGLDTGLYDIEYAVHNTVLSLPGLRRLYFPLEGDKDPKHAQAVNVAGRAVIAALALAAETLVRSQGYDLRSHCVLYVSPEHPTYWEIPSQDSTIPDTRFKLSVPDALDLLTTAVKEAKKLGLKWRDGDGLPELPVLTPDEECIKLLTKHYRAVDGIVDETAPKKDKPARNGSRKNDK